MSRVLAVLPDLLRNLTSSVTLKDIHMAIVTIVRGLADARLVLFYSAQGSAQGGPPDSPDRDRTEGGDGAGYQGGPDRRGPDRDGRAEADHDGRRGLPERERSHP